MKIVLVQRIAYLGPRGTNTHQAALLLFPHAILIPQVTITDAYTTVEEQQVDAAVVPSENSSHGTVRETFDLLAKGTVPVIGTIELPIHHALLSREKDLTAITTVLSHPQALAQCSEWLDRYLPAAQRKSADSTTAALSRPKAKTGYIAPDIAADLYGIPLLKKRIENKTSNTTRFMVIAKEAFANKKLRTSRTLLYLTIHNRIGILRDILDVLAKHTANLTQLESRPSTTKVWDYSFFIEIDKKVTDASVQLAVTELASLCKTIRILGST